MSLSHGTLYIYADGISTSGSITGGTVTGSHVTTGILAFDTEYINTISLATGTAFSVTLTFDALAGSGNDHEILPIDIGLVTTSGGSTYYTPGDLLPNNTLSNGYSLNNNILVNPTDAGTGFTISGTPTNAGTYAIYVRAHYTDNGTDVYISHTIQLQISGSTLTITPQAEPIVGGLPQIVGALNQPKTGSTADQFVISGGLGPFDVSIGAGTSLAFYGLGFSTTVTGSPVQSISGLGKDSFGNYSFYIVGTPSTLTSGTNGENVYFRIQNTSLSQGNAVISQYNALVKITDGSEVAISCNRSTPLVVNQADTIDSSNAIIFSGVGGTGDYTWIVNTQTISNLGTTVVPGTPLEGLVFSRPSPSQLHITGTPTKIGTLALTVQAKDTSSPQKIGELITNFTSTAHIKVIGSVPNGAVSSTWSASFTATGGDIGSFGDGGASLSWSFSSLPVTSSGPYTVNPQAISGLPGTTGTYTVSATCTQTNGTNSGLASSPTTFTVVIGSATSALVVNFLDPATSSTTELTLQQGVVVPTGGSAPNWSASNATGTVVWSATTGFPSLPAGLSYNFLASGNKAIITGTPTTYTGGSEPPAFSVSGIDDDLKEGRADILLSISPNIIISGLNSEYTNFIGSGTTVAAPSGIPEIKMQAIGGDAGSASNFQWSIRATPGYPALPSWLTFDLFDTTDSRDSLRLYSSTTTNGTWHVDVVATNRAGSIIIEKVKSGILTVTGSSVTITPFSSTLCCSTSSGTVGDTQVIIGGTVTGGTAGFTVEIDNLSPLSDYLPLGTGPYNSDQTNITLNIPISNGVSLVTLRSVDDTSVTAVITVTYNSSTTISSSVSPGGGTYKVIPIYTDSGPITFTGSVTGGCAADIGVWHYSGTLGSIGAKEGSSTIFTPPTSISTISTGTLTFEPLEDTSQGFSITLVFCPGLTSTAPTITTPSSLSDATQGTLYGPVSFGASGGTGTGYVWDYIDTIISTSLSFTANNFGGTPSASGDFVFIFTVTDSGGKVGVKAIGLHINASGGTTISSIAPTSGPARGGTFITITGTGFSNDMDYVSNPSTALKFTFQQSAVSPQYALAGAIDGTGYPTYVSATQITGYTPSIFTPGLAVVNYFKGAAFIGGLSGANGFNFTGSTLSISGMNPTTVVAGTTNLPITLTGSGFSSDCKVFWTQQTPTVGTETELSSPSFISDTSFGAIVQTALLVSPCTATLRVKRLDGTIVSVPGTFTVTAATLAITSPSSLADATRGGSYTSADIAAIGGVEPYVSYTIVGTLPTGLSISRVLVGDHYIGRITGTVDNAASTSTFEVQVTDTNGTRASRSYTITAVGGVLTESNQQGDFVDARINQFYSVALKASGGTSPYTFALASGSLPGGLAINNTNKTIEGTPGSQTIGTYSFRISVTDSVPNTVTSSLTPFTIQLLAPISIVNVTGCTPSSGPNLGGTSVVISGSGFRSGARVQFGNNDATNVTVGGDSSISCTTPSQVTSGAVDVRVINSDTGTGTLTSGFTYLNITTPTITSIDKQDGPFVGGQNVIIYGTNFNGVTAVRFGLVDSVGNSFAASSPILGLATSPQTISCTTPTYPLVDGLNALTVNIYIENVAGIGILNNGYTYRPSPIITGVIPGQGPTTGGQTIYITGKNFFQRGSVKPRVFIGNVEVDPSKISLVED